jgi:hypothetical protein
MSDAPERIIIVQGDYGDLASVSVHTRDEGYTEEHGTEYIRADLVPAQPSQPQQAPLSRPDAQQAEALRGPVPQQAGVTEALINARSFVRLFHDDAATVCLRQIDAAMSAQQAGVTEAARRYVEATKAGEEDAVRGDLFAALTAALSARQGEGEA